MSDIDYQEKQLRAAWHDELYVCGHNPIEPYHGTSFRLEIGEKVYTQRYPQTRLFFFNKHTAKLGESFDQFTERMRYESWAWVI